MWRQAMTGAKYVHKADGDNVTISTMLMVLISLSGQSETVIKSDNVTLAPKRGNAAPTRSPAGQP